ncbi:MAG: hypothetical protein LBF64_06415, partial [Oscillospiraceae bacterium]|nr:hypothetical protein [Oscillospiraceae bacterium]
PVLLKNKVFQQINRSHPRFAEFISANRTPRGASAPRSTPVLLKNKVFQQLKQQFLVVGCGGSPRWDGGKA